MGVWSLRGDQLIAAGFAPAPTLIKIHVEGFGLEVARGLRETLANASVMSVLFAHEVYRFSERDQPLDSVVDESTGLGYELSVIGPGGSRRPFADADLEASHDFVAQKRRGRGTAPQVRVALYRCLPNREVTSVTDYSPEPGVQRLDRVCRVHDLAELGWELEKRDELAPTALP